MSQIRELAVVKLAEELASRSIALSQANIWDVRDHCDYLAGHLVVAVNHPVNEGIDAALVNGLTGPVYVLCGGGSKAPRAAQMIHDIDKTLEVVILTGGTRQAKAEGLSIVTGDTAIDS